MDTSTTSNNQQLIIESIIYQYDKQSFDDEFLSDLSSADAIHPKGPPVIMDIAPSVVAVSLFVALQRKIDCSGLIIGWNDVTCEATVLTSAKLLRFPKPEKVGRVFHIFVRLPDGRLLYGREDYVNYHHNLITVKVKSDVKLPVVDLRFPDKDFGEGTCVYSLGRDFFQCSLLSSGGEFHQGSPFFGCEGLSRSTCQIIEACEGGPLITSDGYVFGVNFFDGHHSGCHYAYPLPTQTFLPCLKNWSSYGTAMWPWYGLTVVDVRELPYAALERLRLPFDDTRVIVTKVCKDSHAHQLGVRPGYFVTSCDGCDISSAEQYSKILVRIADKMIASIGDSDTRPVVIQRSGGDEKDEEITVDAKMVAVNDRRFWYCWPDNMDRWCWEPQVVSQTKTIPRSSVSSSRPQYTFTIPWISESSSTPQYYYRG